MKTATKSQPDYSRYESDRELCVRRIKELADHAEDEKREWTDEDEGEWTALNEIYKSHHKRSNVGRPDASGDPGNYRVGSYSDCEYFCDTRTNRRVPLLRSEHSFEDYAKHAYDSNDYESDRFGNLTAGDMMRALAFGCENDIERRALSEGTDSAGGYTVPTILSARLIDLMRKKSRVFQAGAGTLPLDSDKHQFAKLTADPTPGWRAEAAAVAESDPTFTNVEFAPKSLAVQVKVSEELLQDSVNIGSALQNSLSQALALEVDRAALLGSGSSNQPTGLDNFSSINTESMGTNGAALTDYSNVLDAIQAMQEDNAGETTALIMAPRTLRTYNGLVDTTGQPLRRPNSIANLPFLETTQIPIDQTQGTATDASTVFLGNFGDLIIGFRQRLRIEILKELYRANLQVGFLAHLRCDVQAWHEESFARIIGITP